MYKRKAGGRRQEAGGRRQEAGGRRQEAGSRRQEVEGFLKSVTLILYRLRYYRT
ncbi:MAG: hypothetical protein F6K54_09770 [Okeania sp. SIO3B5]|uniref:hypothetical protein n=1 Tax=Okeania sp. SIO3B5 TaxID=2607811 RepID=UPI00140187B9|nr:hypothetical protein [Okeania sp. SIO3B5]NEO53341.1 hypothetical protein [Okeania sp. SIO3B5]